MADNIIITPGVGENIAFNDIGGVKYQRVKVTWGVAGASVDASATNPLPVTFTAEFAAGTETAPSADVMTTVDQVVDYYSNIDLDEADQQIKGSAGRVFSIYVANMHATDWRFLKFWDALATNVTVGTTAPTRVFAIPPNTAGNINLKGPMSFGTGITVAAVTGVLNNSAGAPGANEMIVVIGYK